MPVSPRERAHRGEQQPLFRTEQRGDSNFKTQGRERESPRPSPHQQEGLCVDCGDPAVSLCDTCLEARIGVVVERLARTGQLARYMAEGMGRTEEQDHELVDPAPVPYDGVDDY